MKNAFLLITCFVYVGFIFSQEESSKHGKLINIKQEQLTLEIEPLISAGFTAAWKANRVSSLGIGFQFGLGTRVILNKASFLYCGTGCDTGDCCDEHTALFPGDFYFEIAQFHTFWRYFISPRTYISAGLFTSYGIIPGFELSNKNIVVGLKTGLFTGFDKLKIGINFQAGKDFLTYSNAKKTNFFLIYLSPVIQIFF